MHIGILSGGGDCPGINAVIRAVTLALLREPGHRVTGIEQGYLGLIERRTQALDEARVRDILDEGGSILRTHNKADPFHYFGAGGADVSAQVLDHAREIGLDAVVAIGGDGTMFIAERLSRLGLPVVGVPKTIDNDLPGTDRTFGFDSAVAIVAESLGRLRTTARSHGRVMVLETMGRYAGWLALAGGLAGGADLILPPEQPYDLDAVVRHCRQRHADAGHVLVCVSEAARQQGGQATVQFTLADSPDPVRLGGVGQVLRGQLAPHLPGVEVRATLLGHVQRGGAPTASDRILASQYGVAAAELVRARRFGRMVALQGGRCTDIALADVAGQPRPVTEDDPWMRVARALGVVL